MQELRIVKTILKNKVGGCRLSDTKTSYKDTVVNTTGPRTDKLTKGIE